MQFIFKIIRFVKFHSSKKVIIINHILKFYLLHLIITENAIIFIIFKINISLKKKRNLTQ